MYHAERVLQIFDCFSSNANLSSEAISRTVGMPFEQLNEYLSMMLSKGYLRKTGPVYSLSKMISSFPSHESNQEYMQHLDDRMVVVPELVMQGIVHDINNVLGAPAALIELAKISRNQEAIIKTLDQIEIANSQAIRIVRALLHWTNDSSGERKIVAVDSIVGNAVKLATSCSSINTDIMFADDICLIECVEAKIFSVLFNIVLNARQAIGNKGSIKVTVQNYENINGAFRSLKEGRYVKISISDNGKGISKENMSKLFKEQFTTKVHGSGVGLTLAAYIIQQHEGHIEVKSEIGVGTTFDVYLPASHGRT